MSRILLVDDSPHAQRMGERILSDEGYEVVTVSNADSALIRLDDVDPDVVLADTVMPGRTGYEICQYLKMSPRHRYVRVVLTAGVLEAFDEERARRVEADGVLKKPFEASALLSAVKPLAEAAAKDRAAATTGAAVPAAQSESKAEVPFVTVVDTEHVHAAVTVALDASMESIADEITRRVLAALRAGNAEPRAAEPQVAEWRAGESSDAERPVVAPVHPEAAKPAVPPEPAAPAVRIRRLTPLPSEAVNPRAIPAPVTQVEAVHIELAHVEAAHGMTALASEPARPAASSAPAAPLDPARRVTPLRLRTGSILGLDINRPEPPTPDPE